MKFIKLLIVFNFIGRDISENTWVEGIDIMKKLSVLHTIDLMDSDSIEQPIEKFFSLFLIMDQVIFI